VKGRSVLGRSQAETERVRYLLGLASPAEREHVESEYFHDADAFQRMLSAEDDLVDAYARGELSDEERQRFEKRFLKSSQGKDRVRFSRAFAGAVVAPVHTVVPPFYLRHPVRIAAVAAVVVIAVVLSWLVIERRRMSNELRELRAVHEQLHNETEALRRDAERMHIAEIQSPPNSLQPANPTSRKTVPSQRPRPKRTPITPPQQQEQKPFVNTEDVNTFVSRKIVDLPLDISKIPSLLTLQTASTPEGYVAGGRADQSNVTLDGVDINEAAVALHMALNSPVKYSDYRVSIETAEGRQVTSVGWIEPPKRNQTRISPPPIKATDLPAGDYRVRLTGKDADGSFVQVAEYSFKVVVKK